MKVIYKHFANQRYTAFLAPPPCSSGWMRKHAFMSIFVAGHQRTILTGVLPIGGQCVTFVDILFFLNLKYRLKVCQPLHRWKQRFSHFIKWYSFKISFASHIMKILWLIPFDEFNMCFGCYMLVNYRWLKSGVAGPINHHMINDFVIRQGTITLFLII